MKDNHNLVMVTIVAIVAIVAIIFMPSQQKVQVSGNQLIDLSATGGAYYIADVTTVICFPQFKYGEWVCGADATCEQAKDQMGNPKCDEDFEDESNYCPSGSCVRDPGQDFIGCNEGENDEGQPCYRAYKKCDWDCNADSK